MGNSEVLANVVRRIGYHEVELDLWGKSNQCINHVIIDDTTVYGGIQFIDSTVRDVLISHRSRHGRPHRHREREADASELTALYEQPFLASIRPFLTSGTPCKHGPK